MADYISGLFADFSSIAGFVALAATVLGAVSLFLSNIARYTQARKYGIPIKAVHQANIADSANVWVTLIGTIGLGVLLPILLLGLDTPAWAASIIVAIGGFLAFIFTKSTRRTTAQRKDTTINITYIGFVLLPIIAAVGYIYVHSKFPTFVFSILLIFAFIAMGLYLWALSLHFTSGLTAMLFGAKGGLMTIDIDGVLHLVVTRSSSYHWIMIPCEYVNYERVITKKSGDVNSSIAKFLVFERGKFIIRNPAELTGYIAQVETGYSISRAMYDAMPR